MTQASLQEAVRLAREWRIDPWGHLSPYDTEIMIAAFSALVDGLSADNLVRVIAIEQNHQFCATAKELADAIRASLGLEAHKEG